MFVCAFQKIIAVAFSKSHFQYKNQLVLGTRELNVTSDLFTQNLEKEKRQLESAIKRLMQELEEEKGQNNLLSEQIVHLKTSLNEKKVIFLCHLTYFSHMYRPS